MIHFDHIEIHVKNSKLYVVFLEKIFNGGRFKKISENNTFMFLSPDNIRFEIKESGNFKNNFDIDNGIGFCMPCLRMNGALSHLENIQDIIINKIIDNPDGKCIFFKDYEHIDWHIKDYEILDVYTNI
jgi:hypothetical protein